MRGGTSGRGGAPVAPPASAVGRPADGDSSEFVAEAADAAEAVAVFGDRVEVAREYAELLSADGVQRGLLGPREVGRLWTRHLVNSAVVAQVIPGGRSVVDAGSGAGLPGIPLAIARPDLEMTLVDSRLRAGTFLAECVTRLDLPSVRVRRARVEDLAGDVSADVVTARAVASLERLAEWSLPLLPPGGELLVWKGKHAEEELSRAHRHLKLLGAWRAEVLRVGAGKGVSSATVVRVVARAGPRRAAG